MKEDAVRAEQVRTLYEQGHPVLFANLANALVVSVVLWASGPRLFLVLWCSLMAVMTLVRLGLVHRFQRLRPAPPDVFRWGRYFVAGSATAGVLWGLAALRLFDSGDPVGQLVIAFAVGGMGAGAAGTISCYMPAFVGYLLPAAVPLGARMFQLGGAANLAMGSMLIVYLIGLSLVARTTNRSITMAYRLRFENEHLLGRLTAAQLTLEETNSNLERRVSERSRQLEEHSVALRSAQRLEAIGRLAGGIAHDFNNLLTVVLANVSLLVRDPQMTPKSRLVLDEIRGASSRGADLVRQLLAFSRRQSVESAIFELSGVVAETQRLLERVLGETIQLVVRLCPDPLFVRADKAQIEQVVLNLATNARDAMPAGGTLEITTESAQIDTPGGLLPPGAYAVLRVSDTGVGMDASTRERAFDPFFTTKEVGKGTGLGLAAVYGIVEQGGGKVLAESEPGQGSRFTIYLPRHTLQLRPAEETVKLGPAAERAVTILLVEDERGVREVTRRMLEHAGHRVLSAESGAEALDLVQKHTEPIDLLMVDVVMAQMGGPELAERLTARSPGLRVLFISGYSWDHTLPALPGHVVGFLEKPFLAHKLYAKVQAVLDAVPPA